MKRVLICHLSDTSIFMFVEIAFSADRCIQQPYSQLRKEHQIDYTCIHCENMKIWHFVSPIADYCEGIKT